MSKNSIRIEAEDWHEFKDWLIGHHEQYREQKTKGKYEVCRMQSYKHGDDPILISRNTKDTSLVVYGGRGVDLWHEHIRMST